MERPFFKTGEEQLVERATLLGYGGLMPFLITAFVLWTSPYVLPVSLAGQVMQWNLYYAAIILSFMGGVRWGLAMMEPAIHTINEFTIARLTGSIAPALIGWLALVPDWFIPFGDPGYALRHVIILFAYIYLLVSDLQAVRDRVAPLWYAPLRRKLTFFLGLLMALIILRLIMWGW